jgi:putative acetyltransferase
MILVTRTDSNDKNFRLLVKRLDTDLDERNGEKQRKYDQYNVIAFVDSVFIAYDDSDPIACGCYKKIDKDSVEIKRMFVDKRYRGQGISKQILSSLEQLAKSNGFKTALLETGHNQNEAIGLYKKSGYTQIDNYGPYVGMDESLCFRKELTLG